MRGATAKVQVLRPAAAGVHRRARDVLAVEEPLQIRLAAGDDVAVLATTMRTPGADAELVVGHLLAEGLIAGAGDVVRVTVCHDDDADGNVAIAHLRRTTLPELAPLARRGTMTSACGVCGRQAVDVLLARDLPRPPAGPVLPLALLADLPRRVRVSQPVFDRTGGLHAAGLADGVGEVLAVREDVGRHNALDKLLGWAATQRLLPLGAHVLVLSGRASYELLAKAASVGAPLVVAVSAPSSLAVDVAQAAGITLLGFARDGVANVYTHPHRVAECTGRDPT